MNYLSVHYNVVRKDVMNQVLRHGRPSHRYIHIKARCMVYTYSDSKPNSSLRLEKKMKCICILLFAMVALASVDSYILPYQMYPMYPILRPLRYPTYPARTEVRKTVTTVPSETTVNVNLQDNTRAYNPVTGDSGVFDFAVSSDPHFFH